MSRISKKKLIKALKGDFEVKMTKSDIFERFKNPEEIQKQKIQSFTTLIINGKQYEGPMEVKDIVKHIMDTQQVKKKKRTKKRSKKKRYSYKNALHSRQ